MDNQSKKLEAYHFARYYLQDPWQKYDYEITTT